VSSQMEKLMEATRRLKQKYKYITPENIRTTGLLTEFMTELGEVVPPWTPLRAQESLDAVLQWNSKAWPLAKYILHCVSANRQDMTKCVKKQIKCKFLCPNPMHLLRRGCYIMNTLLKQAAPFSKSCIEE
jgi:hypothetical protein